MTITEKSTYVVTCTFYDETDIKVTPKACTWTLTDLNGNVINSRSAVSLPVVSGVATIVMTGDDLAIASSRDGRRKLLIAATYDSTNGTDLSLKKEYNFTITNLSSVT